MSIIKKYEAFATGHSTLTSVEDLNLFYSCDECNALWKSYNKSYSRCKYCESKEIEELSADEWYGLVKSRLGPDEFADLASEREAERNTLVDVTKLKRRYDHN